jgi:cell division protein FtsB
LEFGAFSFMIVVTMNLKRLLAVPALLLGLLLIFHLSRSIVGLYRSGGRVAGLVGEIAELEKEKERLEQERGFRQTDEFVEREARDKLRMTREGEKILVLPESDARGGEEDREQKTEDGERANWQKWFDYWFRM